jgi:hypothetical protein
MSKSDSKALPKPPIPEYDRFGFQNNLKRSDSAHWSRPWTAETEVSRNVVKERNDEARTRPRAKA